MELFKRLFTEIPSKSKDRGMLMLQGVFLVHMVGAWCLTDLIPII